MAPDGAVALAAGCTIGASAIAIWHIYMHLRNYTEPTYQRYTVRIIFMIHVRPSPQLMLTHKFLSTFSNASPTFSETAHHHFVLNDRNVRLGFDVFTSSMASLGGLQSQGAFTYNHRFGG